MQPAWIELDRSLTFTIAAPRSPHLSEERPRSLANQTFPKKTVTESAQSPRPVSTDILLSWLLDP